MRGRHGRSGSRGPLSASRKCCGGREWSWRRKSSFTGSCSMCFSSNGKACIDMPPRRESGSSATCRSLSPMTARMSGLFPIYSRWTNMAGPGPAPACRRTISAARVSSGEIPTTIGNGTGRTITPGGCNVSAGCSGWWMWCELTISGGLRLSGKFHLGSKPQFMASG